MTLQAKFRCQQSLILKTKDFNNCFHQFNIILNLIFISCFNLEIKLYVKTRLVPETCKKRNLPSAHDLYTSQYVSSIRLKITLRESKNLTG